MNYAKFLLSGDYGHFRYPYASNAPITYTVPPKSALAGLMGAVVGVERQVMNPMYQSVCDHLFYSVAVKNPVRKVSHQFTMHSLHSSSIARAKRNEKITGVRVTDDEGKVSYKDAASPTPGSIEYLENVAYEVVLALSDDAPKNVKKLFADFIERIQNNEAMFEPTLGVRNCFATIEYLETGMLEVGAGDFETNGFVSTVTGDCPDELFIEKLPARMLADRHVDDTSYQRLLFSPGNSLQSTGEHYVDRSQHSWCLI